MRRQSGALPPGGHADRGSTSVGATACPRYAGRRGPGAHRAGSSPAAAGVDAVGPQFLGGHGEPARGDAGRPCTFSAHGQSPRAHPPGRGLPPVVPGRVEQGRAGRQRSGPRHDGHPPLRLRHLGAHAGGGRPAHQGGRSRERLLPAVHPRELPAPGGRPRRGLQPRAGRRHPRRRQGARRARRRPPHQRDGHRRVHGQVDPELPRPAAAAQPVGQRRALGAAAPALPADERVPLAGGPHRARRRSTTRTRTPCASSTRSTPTS